MKKFYSIVLMAAALLVGTNVKAVEVASESELSTAINDAPAGVLTEITLTDDINISSNWALYIYGGKNIEIDLNGHNITSAAEGPVYINNGQLTFSGAGTISNTNADAYFVYIVGSPSDVPNYSTLNVGKNVNMVCEGAYGIILSQGTSAKPHHAYGIVLNIEGYVQSKSGVAIWALGNFQDKTGNVPVINVSATGSLIGADNEVCLYGGGYAVWNIEGTVQGGTGIYAKGGEYNISGDAKIIATADHHEDVVANGNGYTGGLGCAIVSDTKAGYAGGMQISVSGNATIESQTPGGYAIEEVVSEGDHSKTESLVIESGTINGDLKTTAELQENVKVNGTITGGTFNTDVTEYLNNITGVVTPTEDENGNIVYVITEKPTEAGDWVESVVGAAATAYVRMPDGASTNLDADATVAYLDMRGNAKITINNGVTLTAGEIVMSADAVIEVLGGGRLVINEEKGIVANNVNNIVIHAQEGALGIFLLNPNVTSNKNPHATVALTTKSYWNGDDYAYERLGVPAVNGMRINDIVKVASAPNVYALYWDVNAQGWAQASDTQVLDPFTGLALISQSTTPGSQYNFPCQLLGNSDVDLTVVGKWTYFANSYMAKLDLKALATDIAASGVPVAAGVYLDPEGKEQWGSVSLESLTENLFPEKRFLNPMQGFILNNNSTNPTTANVTVDYANMIWAPYTNNYQHLAARRSNNSDLTRVMITITAENGRHDEVILRQSENFSNDYDNGADMAQYMGINEVNIFASTSELGNLTEVASNNINGLNLSVDAKEATELKMTFSHVSGAQLAIRDNQTGATMTMTEDAEYFFSVAEGISENRFEVIAIQKTPTDVETIETAQGAKAVYTILGQFVGTTDKWNILPAGIYVVDGVKMVK